LPLRSGLIEGTRADRVARHGVVVFGWAIESNRRPGCGWPFFKIPLPASPRLIDRQRCCERTPHAGHPA
jgi:hypothetical protein